MSASTSADNASSPAASAVAIPAPSQRRTHVASRPLTLVDYATLLAIGLVVVLVSLPRLRAFALRENELDALRMLRVLASDARALGPVMHAGGLGALLATHGDHRVRFEDLELVDGGRLRRHGYLFDAVPVAVPGLAAGDGRLAARDAHGASIAVQRWVLRAWPWEHGRTGLGAFEILPGGEVHGCANDDGAFSGPFGAPPPLLEPAQAGWVPIAQRGDG